MNRCSGIYNKILLIVLFALLSSCKPTPRPVLFPILGSNQMLSGLSREAAEGRLDFSSNKKLEYVFPASPLVPSPASIEIAYSLDVSAEVTLPRIVMEIGGHSWVLPGSAANNIFHYAIPVDTPVPLHFSIALEGVDKNLGSDSPPSLQIRSIEFKRRWLGIYRLRDADGDHLYISPFVYRRSDPAWVINLGEAMAAGLLDIPDGFYPAVSVDMLPGAEAIFDDGHRRITVSPRLERLYIPPPMVAPNVEMLVLSGARTGLFHVGFGQIPDSLDPITVDPGMVLAWPMERWRNNHYEVFRWDRFPSLLIFDTADYAVQDRMLKRLAFFVEKVGFRGRLAPDSEIAELHGWNAHDYRAEDLARFFQTARKENFRLLAEERELENILLSEGIILESNGSIQAGEGGIISVSRESDEYLRQRFIAHEGFHGLFFIDRNFRDFSYRRWQQLAAEPKRFILSYFGFQQYDTADEYLVVNEFMAHVLQQPVSQADHYFGVLLPSRLEDSDRRRVDLPEKDRATDSWPTLAAAFTREAQAFSEYVDGRWGLAAGRVGLVTISQP